MSENVNNFTLEECPSCNQKYFQAEKSYPLADNSIFYIGQCSRCDYSNINEDYYKIAIKKLKEEESWIDIHVNFEKAAIANSTSGSELQKQTVLYWLSKSSFHASLFSRCEKYCKNFLSHPLKRNSPRKKQLIQFIEVAGYLLESITCEDKKPIEHSDEEPSKTLNLRFSGQRTQIEKIEAKKLELSDLFDHYNEKLNIKQTYAGFIFHNFGVKLMLVKKNYSKQSFVEAFQWLNKWESNFAHELRKESGHFAGIQEPLKELSIDQVFNSYIFFIKTAYQKNFVNIAIKENRKLLKLLNENAISSDSAYCSQAERLLEPLELVVFADEVPNSSKVTLLTKNFTDDSQYQKYIKFIQDIFIDINSPILLLADLLFSNKQFEEATSYYKKAFEGLEHFNMRFLILERYLNRLNLSESKTEIFLIKESIKELTNEFDILQLHFYGAYYNEKAGNYVEALHFLSNCYKNKGIKKSRFIYELNSIIENMQDQEKSKIYPIFLKVEKYEENNVVGYVYSQRIELLFREIVKESSIKHKIEIDDIIESSFPEKINQIRARISDNEYYNTFFNRKDYSDVLSYLTLSQLKQICLVNWNLLGLKYTLGEKKLIESRLIEFENIRNNIAHFREITSKEAEQLEEFYSYLQRIRILI